MYFDSIWKGRKDDDQMGVCGETEEEARQNTANYTQIPKKSFAPSPWKDARLTSCEMEYDRGEFRGCRLGCPKFGCLAKRHSVWSIEMAIGVPVSRVPPTRWFRISFCVVL
jgi:hypothetical protein